MRQRKQRRSRPGSFFGGIKKEETKKLKKRGGEKAQQTVEISEENSDSK
jgi:hypothetical protein